MGASPCLFCSHRKLWSKDFIHRAARQSLAPWRGLDDQELPGSHWLVWLLWLLEEAVVLQLLNFPVVPPSSSANWVGQDGSQRARSQAHRARLCSLLTRLACLERFLPGGS